MVLQVEGVQGSVTALSSAQTELVGQSAKVREAQARLDMLETAPDFDSDDVSSMCSSAVSGLESGLETDHTDFTELDDDEHFTGVADERDSAMDGLGGITPTHL